MGLVPNTGRFSITLRTHNGQSFVNRVITHYGTNSVAVVRARSNSARLTEYQTLWRLTSAMGPKVEVTLVSVNDLSIRVVPRAQPVSFDFFEFYRSADTH